MRSRSFVAAALVLAAAVCSSFPPAAAAAELALEVDPTFAAVRSPVVAGTAVDVADALARPDGSLVAVARAGGDTAVVEVGQGGGVGRTWRYSGVIPRASDIATADGELVIAGDDGASAAATTTVLWLRPDGSVRARATQPPVYDAPYVQTVDAVALLPGTGGVDGGAVVAGTAAGYLLVHWFDRDGAVQATVVQPMGERLRVRAVAALDDGTVVVGGGSGGEAFLARVDAGGVMRWSSTLGGGEAGDIVIEDGAVIAAIASGSTYWLARVSADGARDVAFGGRGVTLAAPGRVRALEAGGDGGYVVSGTGGLAGEGGRSAVAIARFDRAGSPLTGSALSVDLVPLQHERGRALVTSHGLVLVGESGNDGDGDELFVAALRPSTTPAVQPSGPPSPLDVPDTVDGYWMVETDGTAHAFGAAAWHGNGASTGARAVDIEGTPGGRGYWIVDDTGRITINGDARAFGGTGAPALAAGETVSALASTPAGDGYWLFTSLGRVVARGTAAHHGDMAGVPLNAPVVDAVAAPDGGGYYLVSADGGIFTFGSARFAGSTGGLTLNAPVQSLVPDGDGDGYWLVASDGGVFSFAAPFHGSMGSVALNRPITGMVGSADGRGYLMVAEDGGVFAFGDAPFFGSLGDDPPASPIVAITTA